MAAARWCGACGTKSDNEGAAMVHAMSTGHRTFVKSDPFPKPETKVSRVPGVKLKVADIVNAIDSIDVADPEQAHSEAEDILLSCVPPPVREAYARLVQRAPWWGSA